MKNNLSLLPLPKVWTLRPVRSDTRKLLLLYKNALRTWLAIISLYSLRSKSLTYRPLPTNPGRTARRWKKRDQKNSKTLLGNTTRFPTLSWRIFRRARSYLFTTYLRKDQSLRYLKEKFPSKKKTSASLKTAEEPGTVTCLVLRTLSWRKVSRNSQWVKQI